MEAEYIATSDAAKEAVWMKKFLSGLGVIPSISNPMDLCCDNNGALHRLRNLDYTRDLNTYSDVSISFVR